MRLARSLTCLGILLVVAAGLLSLRPVECFAAITARDSLRSSIDSAVATS